MSLAENKSTANRLIDKVHSEWAKEKHIETSEKQCKQLKDMANVKKAKYRTAIILNVIFCFAIVGHFTARLSQFASLYNIYKTSNY